MKALNTTFNENGHGNCMSKKKRKWEQKAKQFILTMQRRLEWIFIKIKWSKHFLVTNCTISFVMECLREFIVYTHTHTLSIQAYRFHNEIPSKIKYFSFLGFLSVLLWRCKNRLYAHSYKSTHTSTHPLPTPNTYRSYHF